MKQAERRHLSLLIVLNNDSSMYVTYFIHFCSEGGGTKGNLRQNNATDFLKKS